MPVFLFFLFFFSCRISDFRFEKNQSIYGYNISVDNFSLELGSFYSIILFGVIYHDNPFLLQVTIRTRGMTPTIQSVRLMKC